MEIFLLKYAIDYELEGYVEATRCVVKQRWDNADEERLKVAFIHILEHLKVDFDKLGDPGLKLCFAEAERVEKHDSGSESPSEEKLVDSSDSSTSFWSSI